MAGGLQKKDIKRKKNGRWRWKTEYAAEILELKNWCIWKRREEVDRYKRQSNRWDSKENKEENKKTDSKRKEGRKEGRKYDVKEENKLNKAAKYDVNKAAKQRRKKRRKKTQGYKGGWHEDKWK